MATVTAATVTTTTPATTTVGATTATSTKVNANSASQAELQAAFQAAGISNSAQWAREVVEYRPYTADDTNWGKLRKELAKYNIASDVLEKIIAMLIV
jgi:DNA uptake protein ComE-like DNA-binding protein